MMIARMTGSSTTSAVIPSAQSAPVALAVNPSRSHTPTRRSAIPPYAIRHTPYARYMAPADHNDCADGARNRTDWSQSMGSLYSGRWLLDRAAASPVQ